MLSLQQLSGLREGVGVQLQLPGAVEADVFLTRQLRAAAEHTDFVEQCVFGMNVGVFQKHAVIGFGWHLGVDAGINEVKHTAAGRLLHFGGEHIVAALLNGREHLRIIVELGKVRA